jgi:hypothetical protein
MATASIPSSKITLSFAWEGSNFVNGGIANGGTEIRVIDLFFQGAKTLTCVRLPENINPKEPKNFGFTLLRNWQESSPSKLSLTETQVRNFVLQAGIFQGRLLPLPKTIIRFNSSIALTIPKELELGQNYTLVVSSNNLSLSARLIKN